MKQIILCCCLFLLSSFGHAQRLELGLVVGYTNIPIVQTYPNLFRLNQAYADLNNLYSEITDIRWKNNNSTAGLHMRLQFDKSFFVQFTSRFVYMSADVDVIAYSDLLPFAAEDITTFEDDLVIISLPNSLELGVKIGERWKITPVVSVGLMYAQNFHPFRSQILPFNPYDVALRSLLTVAPRTFHTISSFGVQAYMMELAIGFERSFGRVDESDSQLYKSIRMVSVRIRVPLIFFELSNQKNIKRLRQLRNKI